jgi:hypothetical protein
LTRSETLIRLRSHKPPAFVAYVTTLIQTITATTNGSSGKLLIKANHLNETTGDSSKEDIPTSG